MAIRSVRDVALAYEEGRFHTQRVFKTASTTGDGQWIDWAFASGQPAFDARIGSALALNPFVASRNDAVFFPGIGAGQERRLAGITLATVAGGTNQASVSAVVYDLLAVYPLIDGDSTDEQLLDNTLSLPRYSDGAGVFPVMVNHVAPQIAAANGTMGYIDHAGNARTVPIRATLTGQNKVVSASPTGGACNLSLDLNSGSRGVRAVTSIQFTTAPGGLYAIYLVRILTGVLNCDGALLANKVATVKDLAIHNGFNLPRIFDGAHLGLFMMPNGGARTVSVFGDFTFVWG